MKKAGHIDAPPRVVSAMFANVRRWTAWMPGVQSVQVLEQTPESTLALIRQRLMGRRVEQTMSFRIEEDALHQRQLKGFFRKWEVDWRFLPSPSGEGTTILVDIDFDLGLLGRLSPRRLIQDTFDRLFDDVMDKAEARARAILTGDTLSAPLQIPDVSAVLQVYQTERGLEVRFGGRRYLIQELGSR